jgi:uncharacterized protein involved in outer membrane biogenesis
MQTTTAHSHSSGRTLWLKIVAIFALVLLALALLIAFFPWDTLRGPVNRYVSNKTGRHFEITRRLDVKLGRTTRILADGIEFANPDWALDRNLVKAESAEIQVELLPLLKRRIVMPRIELRKPELGLQVEADGRRTWALGRDSSDPKNVPDIGALVIDQGTAHYVDTEHGADIHTDFAINGPVALKADKAQPGQDAMPLSFNAKGTWQKEAFTAKGRTGNVLYLSSPLQTPFPIEVEAAAGATQLTAHGAIASLATLDGADAVFDLKGKDLADLYKLIGVVLPSTPRYAVRGRVAKQGAVWRVSDIHGKLGNSDLAGELAFDKQQRVPHLAGKLTSNLLDFDDLAPLVGLPEQPRSAAGSKVAAAQADSSASGKAKGKKAARDPSRKVLPTAKLDLVRLKKMNSEVSYSAARVTNARKAPLDRISVQVRLKDGVLNLDPLDLGVAGGTMTGKLRIDSHSDPAIAEVHLDGRSLELSKMFRDVSLTKTSFGKVHGIIDLKGQGNSVAQMLGGSNGNLALLMGQGQISNLLLEFAGLDGAEIIKFLIRGDNNVPVRCAATAFDVKGGLMTSRATVLDTMDTVIYGEGSINLGTEEMDLYFKPYPKDASILTLRSPLKLSGTLGAPQAGPDKTALAGRAGLALALGAINPLLALAATVETGPGKDADCGAILREAASPNVAARAEASSRAQPNANSMGAPGTRLKKSMLGQGEGGTKPAAPPAAVPPNAALPAAPATDAPGAAGKIYGQ